MAMDGVNLIAHGACMSDAKQSDCQPLASSSLPVYLSISLHVIPVMSDAKQSEARHVSIFLSLSLRSLKW